MDGFGLWIEERLDREAVEHIKRRVWNSEGLAAAFPLESSAIYRVPLPDERRIEMRFEGSGEGSGEAFSWTRPILERLGFGPRAYVLDARPTGLFERRLVLFVFEGPWSALRFEARGAHGLAVNGRPFPLFDGALLRRSAVYNASVVAALWAPTILAQAGPHVLRDPVGPPLHGPWPERDRPIPSTDPAPSTYTPEPVPHGDPNDPPPTFLFYGICFQGKNDVDDLGQPTDPLWTETRRVHQAFARRGYRARSALAGGAGLDGGLPADIFEGTLQSLDRDVPPTFCNSPRDQMVLYIAAHGYGAPYNPTRQAALKWESVRARGEGDIVWIPQPTLWQMILQNSAVIRNHPEKVYLLVESCRSGTLFDHRPSQLGGLKLMTAAPDGDTLVNAHRFSMCIMHALTNPRVDTWQRFIDAVKYCLSRMGGHEPRNGPD